VARRTRRSPETAKNALRNEYCGGLAKGKHEGKSILHFETNSEMQLNYYIYYRVAPTDTARVRSVVESVQTALARETGIQGRLLRRDDETSTWMEIYENVVDSLQFEAALERVLALHDFDGCLAAGSRRHTERFTAF
jgi:hypothetical protein